MFQPSREAKLALRQLFGVGTGRISNAVVAYSASPAPHNDHGFLIFCRSFYEKNLVQPTIPLNWMPGRSHIEGIPQHLIGEYLSLFRSRYAGRPVVHGDFDAIFSEFCLMRWGIDSRNRNAIGATFMTNEWEPEAGIISRILSLGLNAELVVAEFRLYWMDSGEIRSNWDELLLKHIRRLSGTSE